jgi:hypothetical protein
MDGSKLVIHGAGYPLPGGYDAVASMQHSGIEESAASMFLEFTAFHRGYGEYLPKNKIKITEET